MLFAGFGFLMTFLKNYGYPALGFTIIITASITEFAILCFGWSRLGPGEYTINITMIESVHCMQCVLCIVLQGVGGRSGRRHRSHLLRRSNWEGGVLDLLHCNPTVLSR